MSSPVVTHMIVYVSGAVEIFVTFGNYSDTHG